MTTISIVGFLTCAVLLVGSSWAIRCRHPEATVTALFDRLMSDRAVRIAVLVCWWWLGWHLLAGQTL